MVDPYVPELGGSFPPPMPIWAILPNLLAAGLIPLEPYPERREREREREGWEGRDGEEKRGREAEGGWRERGREGWRRIRKH